MRRRRRTFEFEGKVIGEMSTFVISSQEEEGVGVPDLERPEVKYALGRMKRQRSHDGTRGGRTSMEK